MRKKELALPVGIILLVAGFYFYLYRDSFRKPHIQISHTIRPDSSALLRESADGADHGPDNVVNFGLAQPYQLTAIKVVPVAELETNKYAHPVWELVADSNSVPVNAFSYGSPIPGMHPPEKDASAGPLDANVPYRLVVEAGSTKGQHDFTIPEDTRAAP
jgi:hypothetical protein